MDDCIFCKIVKGEVPSYKIYEDENFLAFLDIFPATEGYTLVIPKTHYRWVWDVDNAGEYFEICKKIAQNIKGVTNHPAVYSMIIGDEVPHAHIRLWSGADPEFKNKLIDFVQSSQTNEVMDSEKGKKLQNKFKVNA